MVLLHCLSESVLITLGAFEISIHKEFCLRQGISSPISDLTERLLLEEKDAPATPQESLYEVPPFDEVVLSSFFNCVLSTWLFVLNYVMSCSLAVHINKEDIHMKFSYSIVFFCLVKSVIQVDIQALAHAVQLTRQGAVDSLRFAKGNLIQAFQVLIDYRPLLFCPPIFHVWLV